jgi:hypothetical protein
MHILANTCIYIQLTYVHIPIRATYMHIRAYTCIYVHIRSAVFARICAKKKYVYARMLYVCCDVFARICTYCTYMHVFFVRKVARRIDVRIFAHTCIYVQIRTQIRTSTCKYVRKYNFLVEKSINNGPVSSTPLESNLGLKVLLVFVSKSK